MTEGEKEIHKEKVKKVMLDHLTTLGYPDIADEQIMAELKNMWTKLEEAGLIIEGMSYHAYVNLANHCFLMAQVHDIMGI